MGQIKLLDCTLRDGGYINDWNFGHDNLVSVFERLVEAGVDIIEVGFLDERRPFDIDRSIMPKTATHKMTITPKKMSAACTLMVNAIIIAPNTTKGERRSRRRTRFTPFWIWFTSEVIRVITVAVPTPSNSV